MTRRLLAFVAILCLCLSTLTVAYADDYSSGAQVHWYPYNIAGSSKEYCMVSPCSNQFMAALSAIGQLDKYPQLTNPQLTLLSNDDTGGAFYDLAERFGSVAQYGYPSWSEGYELWSISAWADFHTSAKFFGEDHVWYASGLNETMVTNATTDFFKVLNGEVTGGSGDYVEFNVEHIGNSVPDYFKGITKVKIAKDKFNFSELGPTIATLKLSSMRGYASYGIVDGLTFDLGISSTLEPRSNGGYTMVTPSGGKYGYSSFNGAYVRGVVTGGVLELVPSYITLSLDINGPRTDTVSVNSENILAVYGGVGSGGGGGDNHWPDPTPPNPPNPDPPDVPGPPDLPGPPENPTIDPPTVEPEPTGTTPTDYTPWLRAILSALNRLITDLANHCLHIRSYMRTCTLYLGSCFSHLEGYLRDCFEWLADQFEFDAGNSEYDDARLIRVLLELNNGIGNIYARLGDLDSAISDLSSQLGDIYVRLGQILSKIGSGGGGRPAPTTEPEVDEGFDFWQWLLDLISSKLDGIIDDFVGDIGGFLNELISKFPFSIPWDIAAYLTLLDAQRATPVISFVIPAIDGWWGEVPVTVDLQPYDNAMAAVRTMMLILWGFWLLFKTDWLGGVFDGAAQAVTSFFDRLTGHGGGA